MKTLLATLFGVVFAVLLMVLQTSGGAARGQPLQASAQLLDLNSICGTSSATAVIDGAGFCHGRWHIAKRVLSTADGGAGA